MNRNVLHRKLPTTDFYRRCLWDKALVLFVPLVCLAFMQESVGFWHSVYVGEIPYWTKPDKYRCHGRATTRIQLNYLRPVLPVALLGLPRLYPSGKIGALASDPCL